MLRVGIVGLGAVAKAHIETFKHVEGARVTAVCSRRRREPAELRDAYGLDLKSYTDLDAMLPEVDIVDVCTPHPLHPRQTIAAARAGKHVIIEKPIALSWPDALEMREAIREAGVQACVCFECRFSAHFSLVRSMIDRGLLGEIHHAEVDYYHGIGPWIGQFDWNVKRDWGGSSLLTAGCHALDGLLYFMNEPVEEVVSYATRSANPHYAPYEYATATTTLLRFASGRVGKVASVIDCMQPYYLRVHLIGSEGSILDDKYTSMKNGSKRDAWSRLDAPLIGSGDPNDHPYRPQFEAFVRAVGEGRPMERTDFETALETHRVIFAADRSAREGRPVKLSEF